MISAETGFTWAVGLAQRALGAIARAAGDQPKAERRLTEALRTFEATRSRFDAARTHLALAELADAQRRSASEAEHRRAADELLAELGLAADLAGERRLAARR